ncbi:MAG: BatD family protein, partial [Alphaproteobacteria bacterium]|nr:BatD family protein [Alphaproteobacteria bacterium]
FAFSPTQSGSIQMDPFTFQGEAILDTRPANTKYRSILDFMVAGFGINATQPVMVAGKPLTLSVKEKPTQYQGWWLPSPHVALTETYQMPDQIAAGEPIMRTLTLKAANVLAAQMPIPTVPQTESIKVYSNPEKRSDTTQGGEVQVEITFVPTQPGQITLPEIQIPWFNTSTEQIETASVPAKQIVVTGDAPIQSQPVNPIVKETLSDRQPVQPAPQTQKGLALGWVIALMGGAFALGLGLAILILWRFRHASAKHDKKKPLPDLYPF